MELRHLRYFIAAAEEEHFGRASERLNITRPAVSQLIADLESELGTLLFERLAHRVKLTAAGRALLPHLQVLMTDLNQALTIAKRVGDGKSGVLNIGYGSLSLLHPLFRATVKRFHESYPDVTLSLVELPTSEQGRALIDGRIHAGFMHFGPPAVAPRKKKRDPGSQQEDTALEYFKIQSGGLGVVVPKDHWLAGRKSVSMEDLANEYFVIVPRSSVSPDYGRLCQEAGFEPRVVQEVGTIATQLNLISVGMGIGLTVIGKDFAYPSSVAVLPLRGVSYTTSFVLGWVKGQTEPVLDRLIEVVKDLAGSQETRPK
jgi:DNA-binding transcriptional LysR family regulator